MAGQRPSSHTSSTPFSSSSSSLVMLMLSRSIIPLLFAVIVQAKGISSSSSSSFVLDLNKMLVLPSFHRRVVGTAATSAVRRSRYGYNGISSCFVGIPRVVVKNKEEKSYSCSFLSSTTSLFSRSSSSTSRRFLFEHLNTDSNDFILTPNNPPPPTTTTTTTTENVKTDNASLVQKRLSISKAKRQIRTQSLEEKRQRNLRLKRLIHTASSSSSSSEQQQQQTKELYAVKVSVCPILREELRLNGREKRGRVFLEKSKEEEQEEEEDLPTNSLKGLKKELHEFFRCLKKSTYVLSAALPQVAKDGSIVSPPHDMETNPTFIDSIMSSSTTTAKTPEPLQFWSITTDADVQKTFQLADQYFSSSSSSSSQTTLKRPSILLHIAKDPNAPPPPPPPPYLQNMENPKNTDTMTMLSFYSFPPEGIEDVEEFGLMLRRTWKVFGALGRVYVAKEGVNAQMSIPTNVMKNFMECCKSIPELGEHMENGINIDPIPLTMEEFQVAGDMDGKPSPPFKNLHVRVRSQIVADGLDKPLNWQSAGYDMPPLEWHNKIKEAREKREKLGEDADKDKDIPLILDCRNTYETVVGKFEGAEPLETDNFRDSWDVLKERLADAPKDQPIMTYCTGGIRCVKVGAYLTQELGFKNVSRLAGGIIAYDRTLNEKAAEEEPMFKGTNYVFDGRVGRQITGDALGECITCGEKTNLLSNCKNDNCHKRMVQCEKCRSTFIGTCSNACKQRVLNSAMSPRNSLKDTTGSLSEMQSTDESITYRNLDDYSAGHSTPPPSFFREIELNTATFLPSGSHMVSGASQGKLLTQLASMTREGRILELGTFTGYATACFLEGAANAAEIIGYDGPVGSREGGPFVMTMERDSRAIDIASAHLDVMSRFGTDEEAAEEACKLRAESKNVPETVAESIVYPYKDIASCEIVRATDALAIMEQMASGNGQNIPRPFDLVFVDADKTRLLDYVEACVGSDRVLKKGGLIIVDNVLWKGLVLESGGGAVSQDDIDEREKKMDQNEVKKSRRARKLAGKMHTFNSAIVKDDRVEVVVLPMRDGLSIIRKR